MKIYKLLVPLFALALLLSACGSAASAADADRHR
jgi:predicted component of type VI protein secretion system